MFSLSVGNFGRVRAFFHVFGKHVLHERTDGVCKRYVHRSHKSSAHSACPMGSNSRSLSCQFGDNLVFIRILSDWFNVASSLDRRECAGKIRHLPPVDATQDQEIP